MSFMRDLLARGLLPKNFASVASQAQDGKLINLIRAFGIRPPALACWPRRGFRSVAPGLLSGGNRGQKKDPVSPNDRRGVSRSRNTNFPFHVLRLSPTYGWIRQRRDACGQWSAPLRPELVGCDGWHGCVKNRSQNEGC